MGELRPPMRLPPPPPGTRPLAAWAPPHVVSYDSLGLLGEVLWGSVVVVGAYLTATLYGAVIGVPLLLCSLPPYFACQERRQRRRAPRSLVAMGFVGIAGVNAGALVLVQADYDAFVYGVAAMLAIWSIVAAVVLGHLWPRRLPVGFAEDSGEALGLWLQVLWAPLGVLALWPAALLIGMPFLLAAVASCAAGWLRHRRRAVPNWLIAVCSAGTTGMVVVAVVGTIVGIEGLAWRALVLAASAVWLVPAVLTNVLLWVRPSFRPQNLCSEDTLGPQ